MCRSLPAAGAFELAPAGDGTAFHRASTSAIAELPGGGWLVALGPGVGSKVVTAVRIDRDGRVLWRSFSGDLDDVRVGELDPGGAIGLSLRGDAGWQPRRLRVDLDSGALTLADSARGHGWSVGAVGDEPVEGVAIPRERYWVPERSGCNDVECNIRPGRLKVAGALYVLPPTNPGIPTE